jgi:hypothetical protein
MTPVGSSPGVISATHCVDQGMLNRRYSVTSDMLSSAKVSAVNESLTATSFEVGPRPALWFSSRPQ